MKKVLTAGLLLLILFGVFLIPGQAAYAAGEAPANVTLTEIKPGTPIVIGKIVIDPGTYYPPGKEHLGYPNYPYPTYSLGADCGTEYFTAPSGQAYYCVEKSVRTATSLPSNDPYRGQMQKVGVFTDDHQPPVAAKLAAFFAYTENHPDGYTPFVKAGIVWAMREQVTLTNSTYVNKYNQFLNAYSANPNHGDFKGATVYRYKDVKTGGTYQDMVTYTYVPYRAMGGFRVRKTDTSGTFLPGAEFDLKQGGVTIKHIVVPEAGYTSDIEFPVGNYTLVETKAPTGHLLETTPHPLTITEDQTNSVYWDTPITNTPVMGHIKVVKKDNDALPVAGAMFDVKNSANTVVAQLTTNAQGEATTSALPLGMYTVTETYTPGPFILDPTPKTVSLAAIDQTTPTVTVTVNFTNTPAQGRIRVIKNNSSGTLVSGAKFDVKNSENAVVAQLTTNAEGEAVTPNLPLGTYTVTEMFVPAPYLLDATPKIVTLSYVDQTTPIVTVEAMFANEPAIGRIIVIKNDAEDTHIEGARFDVRNSVNTVVTQLTTNAEGEAVTPNLPLGTYTVTETFVPAPYLLDATSKTVTLSYVDQTTPIVTVEATFANEQALGRITVIKNDVNDTLVEGAKFDVRNSINTVVAQLTTNAEGEAVTPNLPLGTYTITETFVPEPYLLDTTPKTVTLSYVDQTTPIVTAEAMFTNEPALGRITVIKSDAEDALIEGAKFDVRNSINTVVAQLTTNAEGEAVTPNLPLGTYTVTETFVPAPYLLDATSKTVTLSYVDQTMSIVTAEATFMNEQALGIIKIKKTDSFSEEPVKGVVFEVRNEANIVVDTLTTDADGIAMSKQLPLDDYIVKEKTHAVGYCPNETEYPVSLVYEDMNTPIVVVEREFTNEPTRLLVYKVDALDLDKTLPGAEFELYRIEEGQDPVQLTFTVVDNIYYPDEASSDTSLVSDENGTIEIRKLPLGDYHMIETKTLSGYLIVPHGYDVALTEEEGMVSILAINGQTVVFLEKFCAKSGIPLAGAEIAIYDETGEIVRTAVTNEEGVAQIVGLPLGTYTYEETIATEGYTLAERVFEITIHSDGSVTGDTEYENEPTRVMLTKQSLISNKPLPGAEFELYRIEEGQEPVLMTFVLEEGIYIYDEDGDITILVTNAEGNIIIDNLLLGDYAFKETKAPRGYIPNDTMRTVEVDEAKSVKYIMFKNKPIPVPQSGERSTHYFASLLILAGLCALSGVYLFTQRKKHEEIRE